MKKLFILIALVAVFIAIIGIFTKKVQNNEIKINLPQKQTNQKEIKVGNFKLAIEIAESEADRQKGLSGRESLDKNSGMLFVFAAKDTIRSFWMKNMMFPLDFIWINDDKIVQIDENIPAPAEGTEDNNLTIYTSLSPIDYVLEVNAGFTSENGIKVGDSVDLTGITD